MNNDKKALFYAVGLIFQIGWIIAYIIGAFSPKMEDKIFWDTRIIFSLFGILISYLLFSLEFNGYRFERRRTLYLIIIGIALLQIIPVFIFTDNPLFRYDYEIWMIGDDLVFSKLVNETGYYLIILMIESCVISIIPVGLFFRNLFLKSRSRLVKKQSLMIASSYLLIIFQFVMFNWEVSLGLLDYSIEINLVFFAIANILIFIAVGPLQTFEILPVANKIIIENIGDGYCIFSKTGILLEMNKELMNILGIMDKTEVIGKKPSEVFTHHLKLAKFIKSSREGTIEISFALWDETTHFEVKKVNLHRVKQYIGFLVIFHNITNRKEYEQSLKASKEDIEQKYLHSQKLDSIGQLAGGIAHEFNNILTIIMGNTQLMELNGRRGPEEKILLKEMSDASRNASQLTKQLLTIGRKNIIHPKVIDVNKTLGEMEEMIIRLIGKDSDIEFQMNLNPECGKIFADIGLLEQILINLIVNSKDAMPNGGTLEISTESLCIDAENKNLYPEADIIEYNCIVVQDTGEGMTDEVKKHIFEPFYTTKPRGAGTGLGLSMVFGAVKQFNGFISVDSELNNGSTFKICIPANKDSVPQPLIINDIPIQTGNRELILVVEDDTAVRSTTIGMLKRLNYEVISFGNGFEAIKYFKKNNRKIHLLFTDVVMQGIKGNELAQQLKKLDPDVKVLFASGYTDNIIAKYGILYKDSHFIAKPFNLENLAQKIHEIIHY